MMSDKSVKPLIGGGSGDGYTEELRRLLRERVTQQENNDRERELSFLRSGSAPPTVERSFVRAFIGNGDVSEEVMRSDPAYVSYYYQNVNLNPRLPPPLQANEDWRSNRRLQGQSGNLTGSYGRRMDGSVVGGDDSLFSMQPNFVGPNVERKVQNVWGDDGLTRLPHFVQGDKVNAPPVSRFPLSPDSCAFEDPESSQLRAARHNELASLDSLCAGTNMQHIPSLKSMSSPVNASLSRTATPDSQLLARVTSPHIPAVGNTRLNSFDRRSVSVPKLYDEVSDMPESLVASLSELSLSMDTVVGERNQNPIKHNPYLKKNYKGPHSSTSYSGANLPFQYFNNGLDEYPLSPSMFGNQAIGNVSPLVDNRGLETRAFSGGLNLGSNSLGSTAELRNFARLANRGPGNGSQVPFIDPSYMEYLTSNGYSSVALNDLIASGESLPNGQRDFHALQKAYFEALLQNSHYGGLSNGSFGNYGFGLGFPYNGNSMGPMILPDSPMRYPSGLRNGSFVGPWPSEQTCILEGSFASLLDEFKGNKTRCFELAEVADHVVEFSTDQYGSRFIQQKLETASNMEKDMVFYEIMPHALPLMTDVFGNYVIQKFFEHGSSSQIRKLAEQLIGHVLTLSLQMYGCRVIQKAIEVVDLDQQTRMVAELDGHIMRCVRDQNGNHVIQKCIECIPEVVIQFIITTFYEQVFALSTHPYGCRVIQRVLEHCRNPTSQSMVMKEIMQSVCMLAQDQYGNYVIQHVLEHGKPHERSALIRLLVGKVVQMSQQKFASNVIEKCLSFGTPQERQIIVNEILGSTNDESEPLQVLMKDQFANYVVQKVLETCDDQQLELILNRIKIHLDALKKYTYGKHIVARVEKLVAAGERRISILSSSYSAAQM